MSDRYHTVILVPHTRAKLRKWRISSSQLRVAAAVLLAVTLGAGFVTWSYLSAAVDRNELDKLQHENESLRDANESFEVSIRRLQQQLSTYEDRTRQLAIAAGLETLAGNGEAGIGGDTAAGRDPYEASLSSIEARAGQVAQALDQVQEKLDEQSRWIAAVPSIAPVRGILTSGFGYRRDPITGKRAFHPALDISAPPGYPVKAPANGVVLRAGRIGGLGNAVYLSHGFGLTTRYGHMSRLAVRPGQRVQRGDVLGYVGETGRATGYHLHYEVHVDGEAVDPMGYILDTVARR
jgi:murein DD-endopeptidase MepM/ murein hydrolase activator NlpD